MKRKFFLSAGLLILFGTIGLAAQDVTKMVAIVDMTKVYTVFFRESQAVRQLEQQKKDMQDELNGYINDLKKLQADQVTAKNQGDSAEELRLDQAIYAKQQFITEYRKVKQQQLVDEQRNLINSDAFLSELTAAIKNVAEGKGCLMVLERDNPYLLYWSPDIDISDLVIARLKESVER